MKPSYNYYLLCLLIFFTTFNSFGQAGLLDTSFNHTGKVNFDMPSSYEAYGQAVTVQPDKKIIVAGYNDDGVDHDFAVARLNEDGTLDSTFSGDGKLLLNFGVYRDHANAVTLQPDGKIIVAGTASYGNGSLCFGIARFDSTGNLDSSFGKLLIPFNGYEITVGSTALALQPDGKIIYAGAAYANSQSEVAVVRVNTDGTLDSTFGSNGKVLTLMANQYNGAYHLLLQPDGKIVITGKTQPQFGYSNFLVLRYDSTGTLDSTFGTNGVTETDLTPFTDYVVGAALQPDGKIIAGGTATLKYAMVRYLSNGIIDSTFGVKGQVMTTVAGPNTYGECFFLQPDNKILLGGRAGPDFIQLRYNNDGSTDSTFGNNGIVLTSWGPGGSDGNAALALAPDNKIVAVGTANITSQQIVVARYLNDINVGLVNVATNIPGISVYPNPSKGNFTVALNELYNTINISLCDIAGKTVYKNKSVHARNFNVNTSELADGIYLLTIQTEKTTATQKIIVAK